MGLDGRRRKRRAGNARRCGAQVQAGLPSHSQPETRGDAALKFRPAFRVTHSRKHEPMRPASGSGQAAPAFRVTPRQPSLRRREAVGRPAVRAALESRFSRTTPVSSAGPQEVSDERLNDRGRTGRGRFRLGADPEPDSEPTSSEKHCAVRSQVYAPSPPAGGVGQLPGHGKARLRVGRHGPGGAGTRNLATVTFSESFKFSGPHKP